MHQIIDDSSTIAYDDYVQTHQRAQPAQVEDACEVDEPEYRYHAVRDEAMPVSNK